MSYMKLPVGTIIDSAAINAPPGFLAADGTPVSRTTYARLYYLVTIQTTGTTASGSAVITGIPSTSKMDVGMPVSGTGIQSGSTIVSVDSATQITLNHTATATATAVALVVAPHGVGDGTSTFNVPDRRSRTPIGAGTGSGLTKRVLGQTVGAETHSHTVNSHNHQVSTNDGTNMGVYGATGVNGVMGSGALTGSNPSLIPGTGTAAPGALYTSNATPGTDSQSLMQPSVATNYYIKY